MTQIKILHRFFVLLLISWAFTNQAAAHQLSTAYANVQINSQGLVTGELQVRLYDLERALLVDVDGDGQLRWQELQNRADAVKKYLTNHLQLTRGSECPVVLGDNWQIDAHFNEAYVVIPLRAQCSLTGDIAVHYSAIFKDDADHKLLLTLSSTSNNKSSSIRVLDDTQRQINWQAEQGSKLATLGEFIYQGVLHIWIGLDHILFLLLLLVACVVERRNHRWQAVSNNRQIIINACWIVTAFTLAHSITLTLTALHIIQLPSRWVELGIAVSVLLVALNNIFPLLLRLGWLTFGFGLLHGMGFAGVLGELGLPADQQLLAVLAFNLGVELGQMTIVLLLLPVLMLLRHYFWYARYALGGTSAVIALVAVQWILQRWAA